MNCGPNPCGRGYSASRRRLRTATRSRWTTWEWQRTDCRTANAVRSRGNSRLSHGMHLTLVAPGLLARPQAALAAVRSLAVLAQRAREPHVYRAGLAAAMLDGLDL